MDVKIEHRKDEYEYVRLALNMVDVRIDYKGTDLILRVINEVKRLKGNFNVKDALLIKKEWEEHWASYDRDNYVPKQQIDTPNKRITLTEFMDNQSMSLRLHNILKANEEFLPKYIDEIKKEVLLKLRNCAKATTAEFCRLRGF